MGSGAISADGSEYHIFAKRGNSNKLVVYFDGGGVAWDNESASRPITLGTLGASGEIGNYFDSIPAFKQVSMNGLMLANDPKNPFDDWNFVFIAYASGDFHTGNNRVELTRADGSKYFVRLNGRKNVEAALDWTYKAFGSPEKIFVAGGSAGAFGSSFWLSSIADHYNLAKIYHLADGAYLYKPEWPAVADNFWKANWQANFGFAPEADLVGSAIRYNAAHLNNRVSILQSHSRYDGTLSLFQARINGIAIEGNSYLTQWSSIAMPAVADLAGTLSNYHYFVTDGAADANGATPHTYSSSDTFYTASQDGHSYADWIRAAVIDDNAYSVGAQLLQ